MNKVKERYYTKPYTGKVKAGKMNKKKLLKRIKKIYTNLIKEYKEIYKIKQNQYDHIDTILKYEDLLYNIELKIETLTAYE